MAIGYGPRVVTDGLVLALDAADRNSYPGSGTTWTDLTGIGNTGTLTNGPTYSSSNGGSIVFDGTNDFVNFGNILNIGTGQFSLEYFGSASTMTNQYAKIASKGEYAVSGWALAHAKVPTGYAIYFQWGNSVATTQTLGVGEGIISVDTVYHVSVTRNSSNNIQIYLNGELKNSIVSTFDLTANSYNYSIGRSGASIGEYWRGNLYCYRHYNRALTEAEIQQNFQALRGRFGA